MTLDLTALSPLQDNTRKPATSDRSNCSCGEVHNLWTREGRICEHQILDTAKHIYSPARHQDLSHHNADSAKTVNTSTTRSIQSHPLRRTDDRLQRCSPADLHVRILLGPQRNSGISTLSTTTEERATLHLPLCSTYSTRKASHGYESARYTHTCRTPTTTQADRQDSKNTTEARPQPPSARVLAT